MDTKGLNHIGIGIDTARYGHHVSFLDCQKRTAAKSFHFTESAEGYCQLKRAVEKLSKKHLPVHLHIRLDVAGQYAENLLQWLHQQEFDATISVGQPAKNSAYRKAHFAKRKADPVESLACARFAVVEQPDPTAHNPPEFSQLRDAIALMEASAKQRTRLVNQLHGLLSRIFPEMAVHVKDLSANWALKLLEKYPTAGRLAGARAHSLEKIPHLKPETAKLLQAAAKASTASSQGAIAEELIRQKVLAIYNEQATFARLEKIAQQAFDALPVGPHRRIQTIKGIGLQTAAALVAKIISIDRFRSPSALIGYFGIFPEEVEVSGTDRQGKPKSGTQMRMSRKGNDLVRRLLYTAAQSAVKWNPAVKALFARQRADGKDYNTAIGHCMAKLLRQVYALWKKDCDFDPEYELRSLSNAEPKPQPKEMVTGHRNQAVMPQQKVVTATDSRIPSKQQKCKKYQKNSYLSREQNDHEITESTATHSPRHHAQRT